ncbi:putative hotdog family 3-hydroxylacyl-ACP dehydratase [Acinetobacter calcoaceticus]|uniref:Putative hotdog family 3-hydroxylacyl-ACP dehydratase n=1 Tax=Acinetobacter calcoaceticus TaxID=471 RepID=A0A4R1XIY7_ACICA|nr:putative hotdog family 3-hydroxylacyl-ACP dehydratase [Acinetobacter calcoaceticus]
MQQIALDYIPHKAPMVFVDHIVELGDDYVVAELQITSQLLFCEAEGLPTWTSIELMAQTISAFAGMQGKKHGHAPKIGYLLGTRKLSLPYAYFALGHRLRITAQQQYLHEGLGQFHCEIQDQQHCISAVLSVYEPGDSDLTQID